MKPLELIALAPRFTIREYSDFGLKPQDQTRILFESDNLTEVINFIKEYFKYEDYFNAVYFIDNKLNKSGYVGRKLTINCGESLSDFCDMKSPLEALKTLFAMADGMCEFIESEADQCFNIIEKHLKALEIIKEGIVATPEYTIMTWNGKKYIELTSYIEEKEFDLLKEVLNYGK